MTKEIMKLDGWTLSLEIVEETRPDRNDWHLFTATSPDGQKQVVQVDFTPSRDEFRWLIAKDFPVRRVKSPYTVPEGYVTQWTPESLKAAMIDDTAEMLKRQPSRSAQERVT